MYLIVSILIFNLTKDTNVTFISGFYHIFIFSVHTETFVVLDNDLPCCLRARRFPGGPFQCRLCMFTHRHTHTLVYICIQRMHVAGGSLGSNIAEWCLAQGQCQLPDSQPKKNQQTVTAVFRSTYQRKEILPQFFPLIWSHEHPTNSLN